MTTAPTTLWTPPPERVAATRLRTALRTTLPPRHVPDDEALNRGSLANPECLRALLAAAGDAG